MKVHKATGESKHEVAEQVARPYAQALLIKRAALSDVVLTPHQQKALRDSMRVDFRKCGDALIPHLIPFLVSKAAAELASDLGVDLTNASYEAQRKFDPGRKLFHYEHYATISGLLGALDDADGLDAAVEVLLGQARVAWILKAENRRLDELGYRHYRPDPAAAYAHAGIELLDAV